MTVDFDVTNSGSVAGAEVPQVYVGAPASPAVPMAVKSLSGFDRDLARPGQRKHVTIEVAATGVPVLGRRHARLDDGLGQPHHLRRLLVA